MSVGHHGPARDPSNGSLNSSHHHLHPPQHRLRRRRRRRRRNPHAGRGPGNRAGVARCCVPAISPMPGTFSPVLFQRTERPGSLAASRHPPSPATSAPDPLGLAASDRLCRSGRRRPRERNRLMSEREREREREREERERSPCRPPADKRRGWDGGRACH